VTKTSCKLAWSAPKSDGGSPVTGYQVEKYTGAKWIKATKKTITACTFEFDDLLEGSDNEFRVCAENAAGVGAPSETTGKFTAKDPYEVPGRPEAPEVKERTEDRATLGFKAPDSDGGSPITGYVVEMKGRLDTKWKVIGKDVKELEFVATGLKPDAEFEFRVSAVNKAGQGQASPPSKPSKYGKFIRSRNIRPLFSISLWGVSGSVTLGRWIDARGKVSWGMQVIEWGPGEKTQ